MGTSRLCLPLLLLYIKGKPPSINVSTILLSSNYQIYHMMYVTTLNVVHIKGMRNILHQSILVFIDHFSSNSFFFLKPIKYSERVRFFSCILLLWQNYSDDDDDDDESISGERRRSSGKRIWGSSPLRFINTTRGPPATTLAMMMMMMIRMMMRMMMINMRMIIDQ